MLSLGFGKALTPTLVSGSSNCTLTIVKVSGGSVVNPGEGSFTYASGTIVSMVAVPSTGFHFISWVGDVAAVANVNSSSTNITMNANYSISASFAINTFSITASLNGNGWILPSGSTTVNFGNNQTFTISPSAGYYTTDVLVDGSSVEP